MDRSDEADVWAAGPVQLDDAPTKAQFDRAWRRLEAEMMAEMRANRTQQGSGWLRQVAAAVVGQLLTWLVVAGLVALWLLWSGVIEAAEPRKKADASASVIVTARVVEDSKTTPPVDRRRVRIGSTVYEVVSW